jgi:GNAT superfamily N-acetyltransferase
MAEITRWRRLPPQLIARCHAAALEDYRLFARYTDGGAIEEDPGSLFVNLDSVDTMENVAFFLDPPSDPVEAFNRAEAFFHRHGRPWCALLFPEAQRAMRPVLAKQGFLDEGKFPGMLRRGPPSATPPAPEGLRIKRADSLNHLEDIQRAASRSYGIPYEPPDPRWLRAPGLSLYVGYLGRRPVVHGALIAAYKVAGVAFVGTVPEGRHRGFARALVGRILSDGASEGCDVAYLWSTPMGFGVYASMGFERILDYEIWSSPGAPLPPAIRRG